jgi:hypothetical protein
MRAPATVQKLTGHVRRAAAAEQRAHARHRFAHPPLIHFLARSSFRVHAALISDLSLGGMALVVAYRIEPGAVLLVPLWTDLPGTRRTHLARVVHTTPLPDGTWRVGCRFTPPLSDSELATAVRQDH